MSDEQDGCAWVKSLLVPAYPGSPGQRPVKRLCVCNLFFLQYCMLDRHWDWDATIRSRQQCWTTVSNSLSVRWTRVQVVSCRLAFVAHTHLQTTRIMPVSVFTKSFLHIYQSVCGTFALLDIILLPCLALHACYSDSKIMTAHNSYWCYCEVAVTVWGKTWTAGCVCVVVSGKASIFYTDVQPVSSLLQT